MKSRLDSLDFFFYYHSDRAFYTKYFLNRFDVLRDAIFIIKP